MYDELISELAAARGRDLPEIVCNNLRTLFDDMGKQNAKNIVGQLILSDNLPQNLYGAVKARWIEIKANNDRNTLMRENWPTDDECATPAEWSTFFAIVGEIMKWHQSGLVKYNRDGVTAGLSIDDWKRVNRPQSWSPIVDHLLSGFEQAYKLDMSRKGALFDFLKQYQQKLEETKAERLRVK